MKKKKKIDVIICAVCSTASDFCTLRNILVLVFRFTVEIQTIFLNATIGTTQLVQTKNYNAISHRIKTGTLEPVGFKERPAVNPTCKRFRKSDSNITGYDSEKRDRKVQRKTTRGSGNSYRGKGLQTNTAYSGRRNERGRDETRR